MKRLPLLLLVASIALITVSPRTQAAVRDTAESAYPLKWFSLAEGFKTASAENKPLIVDFYTDWCSWCKVMDKKTYGDSTVARLLEQKFVLAKYNPEKDGKVHYMGTEYEATKFSSMMGVDGYPCTVFLEARGKRIDRLSGYIEAKEFLGVLQFVDNKVYATNSTKLEEYMLLKSIERNPKDLRSQLRLAGYYMDSVQYKKALELYGNIAALKPTESGELFYLYNGMATTQFVFAKQYTDAVKNFRTALKHAPDANAKARTLLNLAFTETANRKSKEAVQYLEQFLTVCKEEGFDTDRAKKFLAQAPELETLRATKEYKQFTAKK